MMKDLLTAVIILIVISIGIAFWTMMWIWMGWIGFILVFAATIGVIIYIYNDDVEGNI